MTSRLEAIFHVRADAASIEARAQAIAVEQSVEMPLSAIEDSHVLSDIVGQVRGIEDLGDGRFAVRIGLAVATIGGDAGQLLNMLFGNSSLHEDVVLHDVVLPAALVDFFGGPRHGIAGLRRRAGAVGRALTCSALKPQGMSAEALAALFARLARGGLDFIKDDHGLADQAYSPFAQRVAACARASRAVAAETGHATRYIPSLSGDLNRMRRQIALARDEGIDTVMLAPMIAGVANLQALVTEFSDVSFVAHPSLGGAARIAPELLIGKLFPLFGADAVVFPTSGGRFGYTPESCRRLAENARAHGALPIPAGGMTLARVPEILDFYGPETMLLIGGSLLEAGKNLTAETAAFTRAVAHHAHA
jgi:ribulose-bisphosphate carboxylase large chain